MVHAFWFRRDLRLQDNLALNTCIESARLEKSEVAPLFLLNKNQFEALSGIRQHSLLESLKSLDESLSKNLSIVDSTETNKLTKFLIDNGISKIFATKAYDPAGIVEQSNLERALSGSGIEFFPNDSYYAVAPGTVRKPVDNSPYRVYTPFYKAWLLEGWSKPYKLAPGAKWKKLTQSAFPKPTKNAPFSIRAGEQFAIETFERFKKKRLYDYADNRNRADLFGTSKLSHALAHGEIHPRTLLHELGDVPGHVVFQKEIAWREFYADVLFHNPHTVDDYYDPKFKNMRYDSGKKAEEKFEAWKQGKTGYPMVDAGMRQLLVEGWMHNRVRMIVASFLVKDLHLEWQLGAKWFEENLSDFDPASNSHGWQWTAGCGTDASPYYRVFNPILQGYKFDPEGNYVRKYIPELSHIPGSAVHEPWNLIDGLINGYPEPIVDHAKERDESLARLEELKIK